MSAFTRRAALSASGAKAPFSVFILRSSPIFRSASSALTGPFLHLLPMRRLRIGTDPQLSSPGYQSIALLLIKGQKS
jgi:hypothetical protein